MEGRPCRWDLFPYLYVRIGEWQQKEENKKKLVLANSEAIQKQRMHKRICIEMIGHIQRWGR